MTGTFTFPSLKQHAEPQSAAKNFLIVLIMKIREERKHKQQHWKCYSSCATCVNRRRVYRFSSHTAFHDARAFLRVSDDEIKYRLSSIFPFRFSQAFQLLFRDIPQYFRLIQSHFRE